MITNKVYYLIHDAGDGSAYHEFFADQETLDLAIELQEKQNEAYGSGFAETCDGSLNLIIDENGRPSLEPSQFTPAEDILEELKDYEDD